MRRRKVPPWCRAKSQLNSAVRAPPMCRKPVGEGAKRTMTLIPRGWEGASAISTIGQRVFREHLAQPGLHDLAGRGVRQLVHDHDVFRKHPAGEMAGKMRNELV